MAALISAFLFVFTLFAIERYYFGERLGGFAVIFWVFVIQFFLVLFSSFVLSDYVGIGPEAKVASLFEFLGAFALLTIGVTPIFAAVCAIGWVLVKAGQRLLSGPDEDSPIVGEKDELE